MVPGSKPCAEHLLITIVVGKSRGGAGQMPKSGRQVSAAFYLLPIFMLLQPRSIELRGHTFKKRRRLVLVTVLAMYMPMSNFFIACRTDV
ncbi:hypothetical protein BH11PSE12_BH11PSE12_30500 [soil metagenome]